MSSKSTFTNSTSRSYALAVYELAQENSELNEVENGMNSFKRNINLFLKNKEIIKSKVNLFDDKLISYRL